MTIRDAPAARLAMLAGAAAVAVMVAGCGPGATETPRADSSAPSPAAPAPPAPAPAGPPPSAPPAPATSTRWVDLRPGQCLADPPPVDPAVVMVTVLDCAGPHAGEVFHRTGLAVNTALADVAGSACAAGFADYAGRPLAGAGYAVSYLIDSDQNRTSAVAEPSTLICVLTDPGGATLTGSVAGR